MADFLCNETSTDYAGNRPNGQDLHFYVVHPRFYAELNYYNKICTISPTVLNAW